MGKGWDKGAIAGAVVGAVAIIVAAGATMGRIGSSAEASVAPEPAATAPPVAVAAREEPAISFDTFRASVLGKTKAEVRAAYGQPDGVENNGLDWTYSHLPVRDADTGMKTGAIRVAFRTDLFWEDAKGYSEIKEAVKSVSF